MTLRRNPGHEEIGRWFGLGFDNDVLTFELRDRGIDPVARARNERVGSQGR